MPPESSIVETVDSLTPQEKDALIARVASSTQFRRAIRLREFLLYIGEVSTHARAGESREQDIGVKVFGRSPDYDRGADNIVRVNATELRKRVDHYFANEGAGEPYTFQMPRGGYRLVFAHRSGGDATLSPPVAHEASPLRPAALPPAVNGSRWKWLSIMLALLCMTLAVAWLRGRDSVAERENRPAVMRFWRAFARDSVPGAQTDIVLSDESLSLMVDILHKPVSLSAYVDRTYVNAVDAAPVSDDHKADVRQILGHNLVTLGSVLAARQIITLPGLTQHFRLTVPRLYPPDLMKRNNLVILGGKKSNPWAGFFDNQLNFILEYRPESGQNFVLNRHPATGESPEYHPDRSLSLPGGIAVIAFIPNATNTGDVLLLTGSDSDATAAAAEFITSENSMKQLQQTFGRPELPHFEAVIRTTRLNGASFNSVIVASRLR